MLGSFIVKLEELKEITVVEILHEVSLLSFRIRFGSASSLSCLRSFYSLEIDTPLKNLASIYLLLNTSYCDKTIDNYIPLLANSANTIHCLVVICGVPIWVHNNNSICSSQIQSATSDFSGQKAAEDRTILVELLANALSGSDFSVTINPQSFE